MRKLFHLHMITHTSFILLALISSMSSASPANAAPSSQNDDPVAQCAEGRRYYELKQYEKALPLLEAGFANGDKTTFANPEDLGFCALALGIVYELFGATDKALATEFVALKIFVESGNQNGEATTLKEIGEAYLTQGKYAEALEYFQDALEIQRKAGNRQDEGRVLHSIGKVYRSQGRHAEALEYYQHALLIAQETSNRLGEGTILGDIGVIYDNQGRYSEALNYHQQALEILLEIGDRAAEGGTLTNIGAVYEHQGRYAEALEYYQQSLAIAQNIGDQDDEAIMLNNIGALYGNQKQYTEALAYLQRSLELRRQIGDREGEGTTLNNIAAIYHSQGQYAEALQYYQQALDIVQEIGLREGEAKTLNNIGVVYQALGMLEEAVDYLEKAITVFESLRAVAGSDSARASYIAQYSRVYDVAIVIHEQLNQYEKAFFTTERARARAFLDSLTTGQVQFSDSQDATLYAREQEIYSLLQTTQEALSRAKLQNPPDVNLINQLEAKLAQANQDHQDVLDAITARNNHLSQLISGSTSVLDVPQTQAFLDNETTLLSFWIVDDAILVYILTHNTFDAVPIIVEPGDLYAKIDAFRSFGTVTTPHPSSAVELYHVLIDPLKTYLNSPRLIIVPQGELHYLPFAALTDGQRYLMDDYIITYLPSASTLPFIQKNAQETDGQALILGNPNTRDYGATAPFTIKRDQLGPLPFAEKEAKDIASELGVPVYITADATETLVKQQAPQTKILHLAAHGVFNPDSSLDSMIALAPDGENDGWLTVGEVYGLDLQNSSLVVLSACDTQIGQLTDGDEFIGLTRALFFAGAPTVIASLWSVDDQATSSLMQRFYEHLRTGMGKGEALRQAQTDIREQYPNPYYWAAFVLNGDLGVVTEITETPTPVQTSTPSPTLVPAQPTPAPDPVGFPNCGNGPLLVLLIVSVVHFSKEQRRS